MSAKGFPGGGGGSYTARVRKEGALFLPSVMTRNRRQVTLIGDSSYQSSKMGATELCAGHCLTLRYTHRQLHRSVIEGIMNGTPSTRCIECIVHLPES